MDCQLEDVGSSVMADDVEIEFAADDLGQIEFGRQYAFGIERRAGQHLAQRADDTTAAANKCRAGASLRLQWIIRRQLGPPQVLARR